MADESFVRILERERCSAILRTEQDDGAAVMDAAVRGGFSVVEFTLTTPGALELIAEFARRGGLTVGAGTVMSVEDARAAVLAGARFLVSPVVDAAVIAAARGLGVAMLAGTHTPSEMWHAHRAGAELVKLFPAPAGGPAYVKAVLGPMPFLRIVPTHGVDEDNAAAYLAAGAFAVGFVGSLFTADDLAARAYDRIAARAARMRAAVAASR